MAEYAAPLDPREDTVTFGEFRGLRNNVSAESFATGDLVTALNCDIDDALGISRRMGYSAVLVNSVDRDLWASGSVCLAVGSNALKLVNSDYTARTLRSGLTANRPLSYASIGDRVFYANGVELGCVQNGVNRTWGITPPTMPTAAATGGTMLAGLYQFAVTYLRSDGQESGACRAGTIELTTTGGISLSSLSVSTDASVTHKVVYATSVGGETLFRAGVIVNADTTFVIRDPRAGSSPLMTQFLSAPPAGTCIAESRGHMLVADGNRLYVSEPYAPELFDLRKSYPFLDRITMLAPISDGKMFRQHGVYVGTDSQIMFLEGDSPDKWSFRVIANYGVIPGTLYFGDGDLLGAGDSKERIAFFASKRGLCAGKMGGDLVNLTENRFAYPIQISGAGIVRRHRGIAQFLVSMQGAEVAGNVAA